MDRACDARNHRSGPGQCTNPLARLTGAAVESDAVLHMAVPDGGQARETDRFDAFVDFRTGSWDGCADDRVGILAARSRSALVQNRRRPSPRAS